MLKPMYVSVMTTSRTEEIWFTTTKTGTRRAYYYSMRGFRAFPLPLAKAELMIATGQAVEIPRNPFSAEAFEAAR
jgi:hypothetical protein